MEILDMDINNQSFYGCINKFCINCDHYLGGETTNFAQCTLMHVSCSFARRSVDKNNCGEHGNLYTARNKNTGVGK